MDEPWANAIRAMPFPDSLPFFSEMIAAADGGVWLHRQHPVAGSVWAVIAPGGALDYFLRTRPGVSVRVVTASHLYAVAEDELEVEYVEVYELPGR